MNQHFSKKNIEAAIRVAFANPDTEIYINGERSKKRYSVWYSTLFNEMDLYCGKDIRGMVNTAQLTTKQKSKNVFVNTVTEVFCDVINGKYKAA